MPNIHQIGWERLIDILDLPFLILLLSLAAGIMLDRFLKNTLTEKDEPHLKNVFINAMRGLPISFCLATALYWIVNSIDLPPSIVKIFSYILFAVIVFTVTRVVERTVSGMVDLKLAESGDEDSQNTLLKTICQAAIYAIGVMVVLQYCGISITPIITALGVGGMAIAFGLQETMANIFSGLQLLLSKQVRIGDYIRLSTGDEGRITDINWRFTTVTPALNASAVVIPNKTIAGAITTNYSRPQEDIVITIPVGVSYDSNLDEVERVTLEVAGAIMAKVDDYEPQPDEDGVDRSPLAPAVRFHTFAESSINFNVILHSSHFSNQVLMKHEFIKALKRRYDEEHIDIPFPIRTIMLPQQVPGRE